MLNFKSGWKKHKVSGDVSKSPLNSCLPLYNTREFSANSKKLMIITGNDYTDKCHKFWNNFYMPTKPIMMKCSPGINQLKIKKSKLYMKNNTKTKNKFRKVNNSAILKNNLPPINKIYSVLGENSFFYKLDHDSDDEDAITPLYYY